MTSAYGRGSIFCECRRLAYFKSTDLRYRWLEIGIYGTQAELTWFLLNSINYNDQMHKQIEASSDPKNIEQAIARTGKIITLSLANAAMQSIWSTVAQVSGAAGKPFLDSLFYSGAAESRGECAKIK